MFGNAFGTRQRSAAGLAPVDPPAPAPSPAPAPEAAAAEALERAARRPRHAPVAPTGKTHEVGLDDLFFSTTDAKGVIDEANETFCRIARHPRAELIGAPHNIIRHPDMPGGAFKITWDLLKVGKPACAYVLNLAADGSAYWAFATIVPIGDRYLSVRQRPCHDTMKASIETVYELARIAEADSGAGKSERARIGAAAIEKAVSDLGYADYADFQLDLVPMELGARRDLLPPPPDTEAEQPLHRAILDDAAAVEAQLAGLTAAMQAAHGVSEQLSSLAASSHQLMGTLAALLEDARHACEDVDDGDLVEQALPAVLAKSRGLEQALEPVATDVAKVNRTRRQLRFDVEVARLQNEAIGRYVVGTARGVEDPAVSQKAITSLANALYALVNTDLEHDIAASAALRAELDRVGAALRILSMVATSWRGLVDSRGLAERFASTLPDLDKTLKRLTRDVASLTSATESLGSAVDGFDIAALRARLEAIAEKSAGF